ncbi:hypothetical protein V8921_00005, partial [Ralstonia mannitolilytica]|uniref:hypothetical protein n=1 Tax=Ralstonia mannitolilytica TaxID=105219 RepID=UPI003B89515D
MSATGIQASLRPFPRNALICDIPAAVTVLARLLHSFAPSQRGRLSRLPREVDSTQRNHKREKSTMQLKRRFKVAAAGLTA